MMPGPVVAAINLPWAVDRLEADALGSIGATLEQHDCPRPEDVVAVARDADAILSALAPLPEAALVALERCRVIAEHGVGVDHIDLDAATRRGIQVCNVPDYGTHEVADHALALGLALIRHVPQQTALVAGGSWDPLAVGSIPRLSEATWGVVGYGRIGRAVAARAAAFGLTVLAYDPEAAAPLHGPARLTSLTTLLSAADVVSLHAPLTEGTHHLVGDSELRLLKPSAVLVNVARGGLVDTAALVAALDEGRLAGAALDVLEQEPPPADHPLLGRANVAVTPHSAFYSEGSLLELRRKAVDEVVGVLSGRAPSYPVNAPSGGSPRSTT